MAAITATQQFSATLNPKDRRGNPAVLDGVPTWAVENPTVISIEPSADGLSAVIKAQGVGESNYNANGDADLGAGVRPIIAQGHVVVSRGEATVVEITEGAAEEQVDAPPVEPPTPPVEPPVPPIEERRGRR